jgi:hypothetical protein
VSSSAAAKVPVFTQYGKVEMADAARVRQLVMAPNAVFVWRHKDGQLMRIMLTSYGEDYGRRGRQGNPQKDVYRAESDDNPPNVWTFKRNCGGAAEPQP